MEIQCAYSDVVMEFVKVQNIVITSDYAAHVTLLLTSHCMLTSDYSVVVRLYVVHVTLCCSRHTALLTLLYAAHVTPYAAVTLYAAHVTLYAAHVTLCAAHVILCCSRHTMLLTSHCMLLMLHCMLTSHCMLLTVHINVEPSPVAARPLPSAAHLACDCPSHSTLPFPLLYPNCLYQKDENSSPVWNLGVFTFVSKCAVIHCYASTTCSASFSCCTTS